MLKVRLSIKIEEVKFEVIMFKFVKVVFKIRILCGFMWFCRMLVIKR